jgi:hypothetical protein
VRARVLSDKKMAAARRRRQFREETSKKARQGKPAVLRRTMARWRCSCNRCSLRSCDAGHGFRRCGGSSDIINPRPADCPRAPTGTRARGSPAGFTPRSGGDFLSRLPHLRKSAKTGPNTP